MALPNGDLITTVFDPQMAYPVDKRMQVDTLNSRDSMSMFIRWEGMEVYVLENKTKYILQGGRSNEYWKETDTGSGTGGTTFVGQFETADLLPTTGRSAGDYAFVGTGEDFVQYNWDNISGQWVMAEGQTDMASEFFHIGYKTPLRRPVIFPLLPKDVLVQESGDFVFAPETSVARFIFVGEVTAIRGIETASADREIKLVNRTGSDIPLRDKASGIPSGSGFDFGGTDYTWVNGSEITIKGNGTYWELAPNNQIAFSDHLDSVNAQVSVGSDGLEVITGVNDANTGETIIFKEVEYTPDIVDGVVFVYYKGKYYKRPTPNGVFVDWYGVKNNGSDESFLIQKAIDMAGLLRSEIHFAPKEYICANILNKSYTTINGNGATLKLIADAPSLTSILLYTGVENVNTFNINLDGQKDLQTIDHTGQPQQGGLHGIRIYGSKNLNFVDITSNNNYIDGVYVRGLTLVQATSLPPENITFERVYCDGNMRQGISIIGGKKLKFVDCEFRNTSGVRPEAGIDMEPNYPWEGFEDIIFDRCRIFGNQGRCLSVNLKDFGTPGQGGFLRNVIFRNTYFDRLDNADQEVVRLTGVGTMNGIQFDRCSFINGVFSVGLTNLQVSNLDVSNNFFNDSNIDFQRNITNAKVKQNVFNNIGLENPSIYLNFNCYDVSIEDNTINGSTEGIRVSASSGTPGTEITNLKIKGNNIDGSSLFGIRIFNTISGEISGNTVKNTGTGILSGSNGISIFDNTVSDSSNGIQASTTSQNNAIYTNNFSNISGSAVLNTGSLNRIFDTASLTKFASNSDYTIQPHDETILLPTITADRIITLPNPTSYSLKRVTLINSNSSSFLWSNSINIFAPNEEVISRIPYGSIEIESDGTKWNAVSNYSDGEIDVSYNNSSGSLAVSLSEGKNISKVYFTNQTGPVTINGVNNPTSNRSFIIVNVTDYNLTVVNGHPSVEVPFNIGSNLIIPQNSSMIFEVVDGEIILGVSIPNVDLSDYATTANTYTKAQVDASLSSQQSSILSSVNSTLTGYYTKSETYNKSEVDNIASSAYMGFAIPSTAPNETLGAQFYTASENGTYINFDGISVDLSEGKTDLVFDGTSWKKIVNPVSTIQTTQTTATTAQLIDNPTKLRAGRLNEDGTFSTSTSWLSVSYIPVTAGHTYTLSGIGGLATNAPRIVYRDGSGVVISYVNGLGINNSNDVTFTVPVGATEAAFGVTSGTGVGTNPSTSSYQNSIMLNLGSQTLPYIPFGYGLKEDRIIKSTYPIVYVSVTGNDVNLGTSEGLPVRKISRAKDIVADGGTIVLLEGDYFDEEFSFNGLDGITLRGNQGDRVRLIYGTRITSATLASGQTRVYQYSYATPITTTIFLWQHDIKDPNTEISINERHPFHQGRTNRLGSTRLYYASSIAEIESTTDKLMWYQEGGIVYFSKASGSDLVSNPIVLPTTTQISATKPQKLDISNLDILYRPLKTTGCTGKLRNVKVGYVNVAGCIVYDETIDFEFERVEAMGCINDGFSGHGYITPTFNETQVTKAVFKDCYSHDNGDDGTSNHEYCEETIYGGLYEYNGNGVTPAVGAHTVCYNVMTRKNGDHPWTNDKAGTGFSAQGTSADGGIGTNIHCYGCISIGDIIGFRGLDNSSKFINCIAKNSLVTAFGPGEQLNCITI